MVRASHQDSAMMASGIVRILLVEDEPHAAQALAKGLRRHVDVAATREAAIFQSGTTDYDGLSSTMLRWSTGWRSAGPFANPAAPFRPDAHGLMPWNRRRGADCGADDTSSSRPTPRAAGAAPGDDPPRASAGHRRSARRRTARHRNAKPPGRVFTTGGLLRAKEYALLEYLARHAGEVVSRGDIAEHVWDEHYDPMSNVVDVYVQRLRRKLDEPGRESLIRTWRGEGYQLTSAIDAP